MYSSAGVLTNFGPRGVHCTTNRAEYPVFCASLDSRTATDADLLVSTRAGHACCMCGFTEEDTRFLVQTTACTGYTTPGLNQCPTASPCHRVSSTFCVHNSCKYFIVIEIVFATKYSPCFDESLSYCSDVHDSQRFYIIYLSTYLGRFSQIIMLLSGCRI